MKNNPNRLNNKQIEKLHLKIKLKLACGHVGIKCQDTKKQGMKQHRKLNPQKLSRKKVI